MNIYQEPLMHNLYVYGIDTIEKKRINNQFRFDDRIKIKQLDDITKTKYTLAIYNKAVTSVIAVFKDEKREYNREDFATHFDDNNDSFFHSAFFIDIEFGSYMPNKLILNFVENIIDPIDMPIEYEYADKDAYHARKLQERQAEYQENASVKVTPGNALINVIFKPCCDEYAYSIIALIEDGMEIEKKRIEIGVNRVAFTKLSYDNYNIVVEQYDSNDNLLVRIDGLECRVEETQDQYDDDDYYDDEDEY